MRSWDERRVGWRVVGSYSSYQQAQQAVDQLAGARFPVRRLTVVARGLRLLEPRGDRAGYGWAALHGLLLGAPTAAVLGVLAAVTLLDEPLAAALTFAAWAALAGALAGMAIGAGVEALRVPRRTGRHSVLQADRYDLVADGEVADQACRLLERLGHDGQGSG
ncbi:MAG TPA: general stress protein [Actinomycetota bacterium]|nr:general stress protein [Actinomycetota bacterium]